MSFFDRYKMIFLYKNILKNREYSKKSRKSLKYKEKIGGSVENYSHYRKFGSVKSFMEN